MTNHTKQAFIPLCLAMMILFFGCSQRNPISLINQSEEILPVAKRTLSESSLCIMGPYELSLDITNMNAELISKRFPAIGESYLIDGLSYFTISPCLNCFRIKSIALTTENLIQTTFALRHPFQPGDPTKPPSAINRLDLNIFDTVLLVHPQNTIPDSFALTSASIYAGILMNPDGYTTELSNVIGDTSALPYVLVVDDSESGSSTYNIFMMGFETIFDTIFAISATTMFDLYLTFGYGSSAKKPDRLTPRYYNPEFNRKSAWKVNVIPPNGDDPPSLGNTWNSSDTTTTYDVIVEVYDWQIGANVNPDLIEQTDIFASSNVSSVSLDIPGMYNTLKTLTTSESGTGAPDDPLQFRFQVANENGLGAGEYLGLVKVKDDRVPGTVVIGGETDTLASSPNGIILNWLSIPEFATYQIFTATVVESSVSDLTLTIPNGGEQYPAGTNQIIEWTGGSSYTHVKLEYSKDNFNTDIHTIIDSTENDTSHLWVNIPNEQSTTVKVRVSAVGNPSVYDISDNYFSITAPIPQRIVYNCVGTGDQRQIFSIDPQGVTTPYEWTNGTAWALCPKLSPNGRYILYTAYVNPNYELRIINVATHSNTNITPPGYFDARCGDFSHDGTRILTAAGTHNVQTSLVTMNYDGSNVQVIGLNVDATEPEFNSDDLKVYYMHLFDHQVYILDVATGIATQYTDNGTWNDSPHGSPFGTQIAWASMNGISLGRRIYVSPLSSWTPPDYIIGFSNFIRHPCFSPDGTKMVFDYGTSDIELGVYTISSGTYVNITNNSSLYPDTDPDWGFQIEH